MRNMFALRVYEADSPKEGFRIVEPRPFSPYPTAASQDPPLNILFSAQLQTTASEPPLRPCGSIRTGGTANLTDERA